MKKYTTHTKIAETAANKKTSPVTYQIIDLGKTTKLTLGLPSNGSECMMRTGRNSKI